MDGNHVPRGSGTARAEKGSQTPAVAPPCGPQGPPNSTCTQENALLIALARSVPRLPSPPPASRTPHLVKVPTGRRCAAEPGQGSGTLPCSRVPCGGVESTIRVPPTAAMRSYMLFSPAPLGVRLGSNPQPVSLIVKCSAWPVSQARTETSAGPACLAALSIAARQVK